MPLFNEKFTKELIDLVSDYKHTLKKTLYEEIIKKLPKYEKKSTNNDFDAGYDLGCDFYRDRTFEILKEICEIKNE